ncbi:hypothetical protein ABER75_02975 [Niallia taxi]|uniref:hypothetical protein n=1 Tax=Niallia taxi TaxID=2499688 RepID=UPI0020415A14|nr:hypothetical protein [Niallia taxi]MCM3214025.1 hypothetical protein [Niallia taxi]
MRKIAVFSLIIFIFLLIGCNNTEKSIITGADYGGTILEVDDDSIVIGTHPDDISLEASYEGPVEVVIDDITEFTGDISSLEKLKEQFNADKKLFASIWAKEKGENNDINNQVLSKIHIEK